LPYVGNDIVDLKQPENLRGSRNLRFLKKVLTAAEGECVLKADHPVAALWSFWAAKEAAYKVLKKQDSAVVFLPRRWEVRRSPQGVADGEVVVPGGRKVYLRFFQCADFVHCLGADVADVLEKIKFGHAAPPRLAGAGRGDDSLFLRRFAVREIARYLQVPSSAVAIERSAEGAELGPPRLVIGGEISPIEVSLSHDGRFVAFAFLPA